jgi:dinuclear metal center YbgI/SA1388 family protein
MGVGAASTRECVHSSSGLPAPGRRCILLINCFSKLVRVDREIRYMKQQDLIAYLDSYLNIVEISDYGPQGLQVESDNVEINCVALAVDTSPAVIEAAASWDSDFLLVHHGIFWRTVEPIAGPVGLRVRLLLQNAITLYSAHLALDAHPEVGNNAVLAQIFGVAVDQWWSEPTNVPIGIVGNVDDYTTLDEFVGKVNQELKTEARVLDSGPNVIKRVAIISGSAADQASNAKRLGADTFLTGETSHANYWAASDLGINIIYAGHYATETVGVKALGRHLADKFDLKAKFFDYPTYM